ncbi:MAG: metal-dependent hydrolase [Ferrimicrobium sp.]
MMAKNHLIMAAGVTSAISLAVPDLRDLPPLIVGIMVGSLFPDMDTYYNGHPSERSGSSGSDTITSSSARITHALKPVTTVLSHTLSDISGGHRKGPTHSPIGILAEGSILYLLAHTSSVGAIAIGAFLCVLFMRSVLPYRNSHGILRGPMAVMIGIALGYWLSPLYLLLILSFVVGNFVHVLSDLPCGHIPWGWPISPYRSNIGWFKVNSATEYRIGHIVAALTFLLIVLSVFAHVPELRALLTHQQNLSVLQQIHLPALNHLSFLHL